MQRLLDNKRRQQGVFNAMVGCFVFVIRRHGDPGHVHQFIAQHLTAFQGVYVLAMLAAEHKDGSAAQYGLVFL